MLYATNRTEFEEATACYAQFSSVERWLLERDVIRGWCRGCGGLRDLHVARGQPRDQWINLSEGLVCQCGLNGRMRFILKALDEHLAQHGPPAASLVLERLTPLFPFLQHRLPGLVGAEYFDGVAPGDHVMHAGQRVRCESLMGPSAASESLDLIMHFDVIEHVPDWRRGLRESARVLRPGGWLLFRLF